MPGRSITACVKNRTDEKITLKPETVINRLEFVPRKKERMTLLLSVIYKEGKKKKEEERKTKQVEKKELEQQLKLTAKLNGERNELVLHGLC